MTDASDDQTALAKIAYQAYGQQIDFKNYQGLPMPAWDDLGDPIQGAWVAAASAVANYLEGPSAVDELGAASD